MPQFTASQNTSSQTKKREPHRTALRRNTTMKQAQPYKAARDDKVKAPPSQLTFVTKTDNPYQAQQKPANIAENTKKPRENRQKHSQKCANNRNKTQQSVKKKAKIAAQRREKRIKTTTGKAPGRHSVCRTANSNPKKKSARPTSRGNCGAEHIRDNKTNKNVCKQKHCTTNQHSSAPAVARSCSVRRQIRSRTVGIRSPRKEAHRPAAPVDDPTNQAEKNSRTNNTNKQTRRKTLRQHSTRRHKSALCYKIQTHASHRDKKQKTGFNPNFTRKLTEDTQKHRKILCFT